MNLSDRFPAAPTEMEFLVAVTQTDPEQPLPAGIAAEGLENPILFSLISKRGQMTAKRDCLRLGIAPGAGREQDVGMVVVRVHNRQTQRAGGRSPRDD